MIAMIVFAFFLYFPYAWCRLRGESPSRYGLLWSLSSDAARDVLLVSVVVLVPLTFVSTVFFPRYMHPQGMVFVLKGVLSGLAAAVAEETFFRGWLQTLLSERMPALKSILLASALFGLAHVFRGPVAMLAFFPGILMGVLRHRHSSVLPAILFHWFGNIWSIWFYPQF
ncbi:MAG: CPBP family intramembrane metalloprotease [Synergistaceae bacterium]|nr:Synerg-CTERM system glutamic-type intramembrane protease MrtS [Synergistota bacterium]NLM70806.1 CPBP family intramembrane metalloprotease [Synergistaceae bacterium]